MQIYENIVILRVISEIIRNDLTNQMDNTIDHMKGCKKI